jgi:hypothetical protein
LDRALLRQAWKDKALGDSDDRRRARKAYLELSKGLEASDDAEDEGDRPGVFVNGASMTFELDSSTSKLKINLSGNTLATDIRLELRAGRSEAPFVQDITVPAPPSAPGAQAGQTISKTAHAGIVTARVVYKWLKRDERWRLMNVYLTVAVKRLDPSLLMAAARFYDSCISFRRAKERHALAAAYARRHDLVQDEDPEPAATRKACRTLEKEALEEADFWTGVARRAADTASWLRGLAAPSSGGASAAVESRATERSERMCEDVEAKIEAKIEDWVEFVVRMRDVGIVL